MSWADQRRLSSPSPSVGSSMDGGIYRSYDNYLVEVHGVYQPPDDARSRSPPGVRVSVRGRSGACHGARVDRPVPAQEGCRPDHP